MTGLGLLVRRIALAGRWRSILTIAQVVVITALTLTGAVLMSALDDTQGKIIAVVNGGASASVAVEPTPQVLAATLAGLPQGLHPRPKVINTQMPVQANGTVGTEYFMQRDYSGPAGANYDVLTGAMPRRPSEVVISRGLAQRYRLSVGQHLSLELDHAHPAEVVGIARQRDDYRQDFVIAAPGTWEQLRPSAAVAQTLAPSLDIAITLDPAQTALVDQVSALGTLTFSGDLTARKPLYLRLLAEIGFPALALAGAAVGAVLVVRLRRLVDQFTVLAAVGVPQRTIRAAVLLSSLLLIAAGVLGGLVGAAGLAPLLRGSAQDVAQRQLDLTWPQPGFVVLITAVMAAAALVVVVAYARTQASVLRGGGAGRAAGEATVRSGHGAARRITQFCGTALLGYLLLTGPKNEMAMALVVAAAIVVLGATAPDLLRLCARLLGHTASAPGIAGRWATRERWRAGAIAVVLMASLVMPTALLVRFTSYAGTSAETAASNILPGQVQLFATDAMTTVQIRHLTTIAGTTPVVLHGAAGPGGAPAYLANATENGNIAVIDKPDATATLWGFTLTTQSTADLRAGKAVTFDSSGATATAITLTWADPTKPADTAQQVTVPSSPAHLANEPAVRASMPGAILLASALPAGLTVTDAAEYRFPDAADRLTPLQNAAADLEIPPSAVRGYVPAEVEPPDPGAVLAALGAAAACVLLSLLLTAQALREWRPELYQLADLGVPRATILRICVASALLAGLAGTILGLIGGAIISVANARAGGAHIYLPWTSLLTIAAGTLVIQILAGCAAGAALQRGYRRGLPGIRPGP